MLCLIYHAHFKWFWCTVIFSALFSAVSFLRDCRAATLSKHIPAQSKPFTAAILNVPKYNTNLWLEIQRWESNEWDPSEQWANCQAQSGCFFIVYLYKCFIYLQFCLVSLFDSPKSKLWCFILPLYSLKQASGDEEEEMPLCFFSWQKAQY